MVSSIFILFLSFIFKHVFVQNVGAITTFLTITTSTNIFVDFHMVCTIHMLNIALNFVDGQI